MGEVGKKGRRGKVRGEEEGGGYDEDGRGKVRMRTGLERGKVRVGSGKVG